MIEQESIRSNFPSYGINHLTLDSPTMCQALTSVYRQTRGVMCLIICLVASWMLVTQALI
jgi:hypothetical protein